MYFENDKEHDIKEAKSELVKAEAMKVLISNNDFACEIHIAGMTMGVCQNEWLRPVIESHMAEINKFLNGEENQWE